MLTDRQDSEASKPIVLFEGNFESLPIGVTGGDYFPAGEYDVVPARSETGCWRETVMHHRYRRIAPGPILARKTG